MENLQLLTITQNSQLITHMSEPKIGLPNFNKKAVTNGNKSNENST